MPFYPDDAAVPAELRTDEMLLRMLRASDVELDYDAVISSREMLLRYSYGRWPREGFTFEENLSDLQAHERDHRERTAFTYTVMNPTQTECLGCVYLNPLENLLRGYKAREEDIVAVKGTDYEATVNFWVRQSRLIDDLDKRLLAALLDWLKTEWAFSRTIFPVNPHETRQMHLFDEAGLRRLHTFDTPRTLYLYGAA